MDSNEPTAWEDINPRTALARQHEQASLSLDARIVFRNELTACLSLVAPAGMTEESRREWLAVAWDSLKHLDPDILANGARKARLKCDHPSKIVPAIIAETEDHVRLRREAHQQDRGVRQIAGPRPTYCSAADAASILKEYGLRR